MCGVEHRENWSSRVCRGGSITPWAGEAAGRAVDHVIIDQDAVATLAEVRRGSNPEIRRTIVGQLLEHAAHASETWKAEEPRGAFEREAEARGRGAEAELATLLQTDGDPDVDGFWEGISNSRLTSLWVAVRSLRGGFEALQHYIAFFAQDGPSSRSACVRRSVICAKLRISNSGLPSRSRVAR